MGQAISGEFRTWTDIVPLLDRSDGVITCTMGSLRDIDGYKRNGTNVRSNIERKLSTLGVAILTEELPHEAAEPVVLYRQGTPVSELVELLNTAKAGGGNVESTADSLRRLNKLPDPTSLQAVVGVAFDALAAAEKILNNPKDHLKLKGQQPQG